MNRTLITTVEICSTYDLQRATGHPVMSELLNCSDNASFNCNWNSSPNYNIKLKSKYCRYKRPKLRSKSKEKGETGDLNESGEGEEYYYDYYDYGDESREGEVWRLRFESVSQHIGSNYYVLLKVEDQTPMSTSTTRTTIITTTTTTMI